MARNVEDEYSKIRNGNRYIDDPDGTGVFSRDVDRLFLEYENLRNKLYNQYKRNFRDQATQEELRSFIDEQFIRLVKEYKINNPVDFPGYVKRKLYARVSQNFVRGRQVDASREVISEEEDTIQEILEDTTDYYVDLEMGEMLRYIFKGTKPSPMEQAIVRALLNGRTDTYIVQTFSKEFKVERAEVRGTLKDLREFIRARMEEYSRIE